MRFSSFLQEHIVCLDGGMGTLLQAKGLKQGELPERWNLTHAQTVTDIHCAYYDAGSNVVSTNTFGANTLKFSLCELEEIIKSAVANARAAQKMTKNEGETFVALDIGPLGRLLRPLGDLDFEQAVSTFATTVRLGVKYGVDLIFIETMSDSYETKAALLAAKENSDLPVLVSNAYGEDGKLMTGASPAAMVALLEGMGADAIGANCSLGPEQLADVVDELLACASVPVLLKPNAGLPSVVDGQTVFSVFAEDFACQMQAYVEKGVRVVGGCCGTTPAYIAATLSKIKNAKPVPLTEKNTTVVSSYTHATLFGEDPILIGERINPTGKKRFQRALLESDMTYILNEGIRQQENGAHLLDVNVGIPEIDEPTLLAQVVCELQAVCDLPLQIDTANPVAMEAALRRYNGKAMVNSVNGKKESMHAVFPLVKKYGGLVVALTLDETGIPDTVQGRVDIAKRILETARAYGISKKDIVFDSLAMTVSANPQAAQITLQTLKRIRHELGCHTSLGVSNVSFGLPNRDVLNAAFFTLALEHGLSAAILNPDSQEMQRAYHAYRVLHGLDANCADYIEAAPRLKTTQVVLEDKKKATETAADDLQNAIVKGLSQTSKERAEQLLASRDGMDLIQNEIIPALNVVGSAFEEKRLYLPQLLMSAEAAKAAFEVIKSKAGRTEDAKSEGLMPFVLATVHGDIHDIGKNIVKLLMENYGFFVVDLGKNVTPEEVVFAVKKHHAPLVGLSALMTTTVPAMEKTIELLRKEAPFCKVIVGGAVLTQHYAAQIGADYYAKDAMEGVRYAQAFAHSYTPHS